MFDPIDKSIGLLAGNASALRTSGQLLSDMLAKNTNHTANSQFFPRLTARQLAGLSQAVDVLLVLLSFIIAEYVYIWFFNNQYRIASDNVLVAILCALTFYFTTTATEPRRQAHAPSDLVKLAKRLAISFSVMLAIGFALKLSDIYSRLWFTLAFIIALGLLWAKGQMVHAIMKSKRFSLPLVERIALYGSGEISRSVKIALEAESNGLCEVFIYDTTGLDGTDNSAAEFNTLLQDGLNNKFNRIILCLPSDQLVRTRALFSALDCLPARIDLAAPPSSLPSLCKDFQISPTQFVINLDDGADNDWGILCKRAIDFAVASLLLVAISPLMLLVAIAIKREDGGPVFFRQRRHGWNHSVITVWKFRTMRVLEDAAVVTQARKDDPRVTRIGKILRRTSIDELPQLLNVLSGEMSLVGPRPHAVAHNVMYCELINSYAVRHKVKPGITGWAQVRGLRGNSEAISVMVARAEADRWYIRNWSLQLDFKILFMTPFAILTQKNAY